MEHTALGWFVQNHPSLASGRVQESRKFQGHPRRNANSNLSERWLQDQAVATSRSTCASALLWVFFKFLFAWLLLLSCGSLAYQNKFVVGNGMLPHARHVYGRMTFII